MKLYDTQRSGNAWKVRLMAGFLGLPLERCTLSIDRGDLAEPEFLQRAPLAQVPVLEVAAGQHIAESLAILFYLAQGSEWWPSDSLAQAQVLTWLSFEQERHMKPLAQLRLHLALHSSCSADAPDMVLHAREAARTLQLLDQQLQSQGPNAWVATTSHPSIADVALYPYTCMAPMGGITLVPYPYIQQWLARFESLTGYQSLFPGEPARNFSTSES